MWRHGRTSRRPTVGSEATAGTWRAPAAGTPGLGAATRSRNGRARARAAEFKSPNARKRKGCVAARAHARTHQSVRPSVRARGVLRPRPEKRSGGLPGELLITGALRSLSCSVSNQGGSWGFRGIKYGLRGNRGRWGLAALAGNSVGAARG